MIGGWKKSSIRWKRSSTRWKKSSRRWGGGWASGVEPRMSANGREWERGSLRDLRGARRRELGVRVGGGVSGWGRVRVQGSRGLMSCRPSPWLRGTGCEPVLLQQPQRKMGSHPVSPSPSARNPARPGRNRESHKRKLSSLHRLPGVLIYARLREGAQESGFPPSLATAGRREPALQNMECAFLKALFSGGS